MVGDKSSTTWSDDLDLQDALDANQVVHRYTPLISSPTRTPGGYIYKDFYSDGVSNWETDTVLSSANYTDLTSMATLSDLIVGHWGFPTQPGLPVYATGKTYDLFGAAADLLESEAAGNRKKVDVSETGGASIKRSQAVEHMMTLAAQYRSKQSPRRGSMIRSDVATGGGGSASQVAGRGGWLDVRGDR